MHKTKQGTLTAGLDKYNFKEEIDRFAASEIAFLSMTPVNGTTLYWKQFLYGILGIVKQWGIPTYFLTLPCAELR